MKKYTQIIMIILIIILSIASTPVTFQNDTYYTIKVGETIANEGIDFKDNFSWHKNLNYSYPHWLYNYITFIIYDNFSLTGIYIFTVILSIILGLTLYLVSANLSRSKSISFLLTIITMVAMQQFIAARAQLITFILFILIVFFIEKYLEKKEKKYIIPLLLIPLIIANIHSAVFYMTYILYLPYIGEYIVAKLINSNYFINKRIDKLKNRSKKKKYKKACLDKIEELKIKKKKIKEKVKNPYKIKLVENKNTISLIVIMLISFLTGFLTPTKLEPYTHLIKLMIGTTTEHIHEHQPIVFADNISALLPLIIFLAILIFSKVKIRLKDLFMFGGLTIMTIMSARQMSMLLIIGIIILAKLIKELVGEKRLEVLEKDLSKKSITILMIIIFILPSLIYGIPKINDKYISKELYPVDAANYIVENLNIEEIRLYNEYTHGSYLLYRGIPVFIDSRADLYSPEFNKLNNDIFNDSYEITALTTNYDEKFTMYGITHILVTRSKKLNTMIKANQLKDKDYIIIYEDQNHILYEKLAKY